MTKALAVVVALLAGLAGGGMLMMAIQDVGARPGILPPLATGVPGDDGPGAVTTSEPETTTTMTEPPPPAPPSDRVLLAWTPGRLPDGFAADVASLPGVTAVTSVRADIAHLTASFDASGRPVDVPADGFVIPIEMMGLDPATFPDFVSAKDQPLLDLEPTELVLGATSARLRRLGVGGVLEFEGGSTFTVAAIVDDAVIGGGEAAVLAPSALTTVVATERYLLIRYSGDRVVIETAVRELLPEGTAVRIRGPGETPVFRHGDAVLPQVAIKERFGEFAYRPGAGQPFEIDPAWIGANIVTAEVPILGEVTCHRSFIPALAGALGDLAKDNLGFLVEPTKFAGCWNPRFIADRRGISRHAWGVAADINFGSNPTGQASPQDPRLIEAMERWGLVSGHDWLIPDPGHFEYFRPPAAGS